MFLLPQSLARQLPRRRSPHLTINLSNFTQTPQSASLTAPLQGRLWGGTAHGCWLRLERSRNSATVHGFMILCPSWYRENIGIIDFSDEIMRQYITSLCSKKSIFHFNNYVCSFLIVNSIYLPLFKFTWINFFFANYI